MKLLFGIDIGGTDIKLAVLSVDGDVLKEGVVPTLAGNGPGQAADRVKVWAEANLPEGGELIAAGVGCAGLIESESGIVVSSPNLREWAGTSLLKLYSGRFDVPVVVANDANCAAYGEYHMGSGKGTRVFVCVTLGTGVGGGIVIDGKLFTGSAGFAGEIGHMVIDPAGPVCTCGKRGCLEAFIGADAIVREAKRRMTAKSGGAVSSTEDLTVRDIAVAASRGDEVAVEVLADTGALLGAGLADIAHIINPDRIAIGGGVSGAGELILAPARKRFAELLMHEALGKVEIVQAELGNTASSIGAALLARGRFV
ncbi:MAG: hypothetical protein B6D63_03460 [Candidatus Latescibacteria bacterium 4484_7]|nr:MAG: hypothetical protein B6D63_03460 [Candidatus Latescibacteria bacterium 4484_7]RKZ07839.1 MAG: ROK family protein [bacterium]